MNESLIKKTAFSDERAHLQLAADAVGQVLSKYTLLPVEEAPHEVDIHEPIDDVGSHFLLLLQNLKSAVRPVREGQKNYRVTVNEIEILQKSFNVFYDTHDTLKDGHSNRFQNLLLSR